MQDVRVGIDAIDRELVRLIAERQSFIEAAARIKELPTEVRVEWRIEDVVAKVLAAARQEGLSPHIAEPVWRELIERCIEHEMECWHAMRDASKKTWAAR
jgi:isochorismate pyruvate lyase